MGPTTGEPPVFDLYLITDPAAPNGLVASARAALAGGQPGRVALQLRAKAHGPEQLREFAHTLRGVTREAGALFLLNTHLHLAREVEADGVHLPAAGPSVAEARDALPDAIVGVSCHDRPSLERATVAGADFATLSPVFEVPNRPAPLGVDGFRKLVDGIDMPVIALGGVRRRNVADLIASGAAGVAVIREVFHTPDPMRATRALLESLATTAARSKA